MGIIRVLDYVPRCYNSTEGQIVHNVIDSCLKDSDDTTLVVSFDGVESVPSSFVNAALISLLEKYDFAQIKKRLRFSDTNSQINEMIRTRFFFEADRKKKAIA